MLAIDGLNHDHHSKWSNKLEIDLDPVNCSFQNDLQAFLKQFSRGELLKNTGRILLKMIEKGWRGGAKKDLVIKDYQQKIISTSFSLYNKYQKHILGFLDIF